MKLPTNDSDHLRQYYAMLAITPESELSKQWEEITGEEFLYWAEVVFPARMEGRLEAFACGEPTCDGPDGTIHETCVKFNNRYFRRPASIESFDWDRYVSEIKNQFQITKEK